VNYKYDVVRSSRKSIAVIISTENKITVRCGWDVRLEQIEKFLDEKSAWIEKTVLQNSKKLAFNDDVLEYRKIYVAGKTVPLVYGTENRIDADCVSVINNECIEPIFIKVYSDNFKTRVGQWALKSKLSPASVSVKNYKGRWGCCDANNNLIFNYKLFMLPHGLQDYVIVHELCHTICHNHSHAFWRLVEEIMPDYLQRRKELRNFDFITTLY